MKLVNRGMGIFDSGTDISRWDKTDWAVAAVVGYALYIAVSALGLSFKRLR